jgi:hypothetical protein
MLLFASELLHVSQSISFNLSSRNTFALLGDRGI